MRVAASDRVTLVTHTYRYTYTQEDTHAHTHTHSLTHTLWDGRQTFGIRSNEVGDLGKRRGGWRRERERWRERKMERENDGEKMMEIGNDGERE